MGSVWAADGLDLRGAAEPETDGRVGSFAVTDGSFRVADGSFPNGSFTVAEGCGGFAGGEAGFWAATGGRVGFGGAVGGTVLAIGGCGLADFPAISFFSFGSRGLSGNSR